MKPTKDGILRVVCETPGGIRPSALLRRFDRDDEFAVRELVWGMLIGEKLIFTANQMLVAPRP